jgi:hypothetical protein
VREDLAGDGTLVHLLDDAPSSPTELTEENVRQKNPTKKRGPVYPPRGATPERRQARLLLLRHDERVPRMG